MGDLKKPLPPYEEKSGYSTGAKVAVGCGVAFLVGIMAVCGGLGFLGWWGLRQVESLGEEYVAKGYKREMGQVINVPGPVEEPTVYIAQVVRVQGTVNADVAFLAQAVEIHGTVNGDIDFTGQVLHIQPGAVVKGDIRVKAAQVVNNQGTVEGEIMGDYGVLQVPDASREAPSSPEDPAAPQAPESPDAPKPPQPVESHEPAGR